MRSGRAPLVRYLLALCAGTLAGETLLANAYVQGTLVLPFSRWQGTLVERFVLDGPLTVSVEPGCSGLDVIALCLAATLAYPVSWRTRLTGAAMSVALLLSLNVLRIATLSAASRTAWFGTMHLSVWPALLVCAATLWVVIWIRAADRATTPLSPAVKRFTLWSAAMLVLYAVAVPVLTELHVLDRAARGAAHLAAFALAIVGADVSVTARVLRVGGMQYLITPECVTTPLIAFYLAALLASPLGWRTRLAGALASVPIFATLAVLRLLTVAVPVMVDGTTLILTHAFNQILTGVAALVGVAVWWRGERSQPSAAAFALAVAAGAAVLSGVAGLRYALGWAGLLRLLHLAVPPGLAPGGSQDDPQGALVILPIYQLALFAAAWIIARPHARHARWAAAAATLVVSQFAFLALQGWMHAAGVAPLSALAIRGWAVAVPVLLMLAAGRDPAFQPPAAMEDVPA